MSEKLYIKNMVCSRCIKVAREELSRLGHQVLMIELGKVEIEKAWEDLSLNEVTWKK